MKYKHTIQGINTFKSWFFEEINKTYTQPNEPYPSQKKRNDQGNITIALSHTHTLRNLECDKGILEKNLYSVKLENLNEMDKFPSYQT